MYMKNSTNCLLSAFYKMVRCSDFWGNYAFFFIFENLKLSKYITNLIFDSV